MAPHPELTQIEHHRRATVDATVKGEGYQPPKTGLLSVLPRSWVPYAELIRLDKPAGGVYLYFPCLFSSLLASRCGPLAPAPAELLWVNLLLFLEAMIYRSLACTWNDILDADIDSQVTRTRLRPMARGAVSSEKAAGFTLLQLGLGTGLAYSLRPVCVAYSIPFLILLALYPYGKRITFYPQVILGLGWAWGSAMGFPAVGLSPFTSSTTTKAMLCLYFSNVIWSIMCDTIYSHQDLEDDKLAGVKSITIIYEGRAKPLLVKLSLLQLALLVGCGRTIEASGWYYCGTCVGGGLTLALMIIKVNLKKADSCMWWFKWGSVISGCAISTGFVYEYSRIF